MRRTIIIIYVLIYWKGRSDKLNAKLLAEFIINYTIVISSFKITKNDFIRSLFLTPNPTHLMVVDGCYGGDGGVGGGDVCLATVQTR